MATATKPRRPAAAIQLVWKQESVRADCETARVRRWETKDGAYCMEERTDNYGDPLVRYLAFRRVCIGPRGSEYALVGGIEAKRRRRRGDRLVYQREYLKRLLRQAMRLCEEDARKPES